MVLHTFLVIYHKKTKTNRNEIVFVHFVLSSGVDRLQEEKIKISQIKMLLPFLFVFLVFGSVFVNSSTHFLRFPRDIDYSDEYGGFLPIDHFLYPPRLPFYTHKNQLKHIKSTTKATKPSKTTKWTPKSGKDRYKEICRIALGGLSKCYG